MIEHITNPLEYIECIIAFDPLDWSADSRHATVYAIVLGWSDEAYTELQNEFNWNDEAVKRLKKFHEEWERMRDARKLIRCKDCENWGQDGYREGCKYAVEIMTENDFCSRAEPKEDSDAVGSI